MRTDVAGYAAARTARDIIPQITSIVPYAVCIITSIARALSFSDNDKDCNFPKHAFATKSS